MLDLASPPELAVSQWLNSDAPITLEELRGKVVVVAAFQMLCPGCVSQGLPQVQRLRERFSPDEVAVIGLHTVFEHHEVMTPKALEVFIQEYRLGFPIGIDRAQGDGIPATMQAYEMRGTPSLLIFDRLGRLRRHYFGKPEDMILAAEIMAMVLETDAAATEQKLHAALVMPHAHHHHDHDHDHHHGHDHGPGCGCNH